MSEGKRVRAEIVVHTAPRTERVDLLLLDESWLEDAKYPSSLACHLWEEGIQEDEEVAISLRLIPAGVEIRKPYGVMKYRVVDDRYAPVPCEEGQVVVVDVRAVLHQEDGEKPWIVRLSDIVHKD